MADEILRKKKSVIVIGGGVSGLAIAQKVANMGMTTTLIEKGECCNATSDNSLRIIHGGFRYLQSLDFRRLVASLCDQTNLINDNPDIVKPLSCYMALSGKGLKSRWPIEAASRLYAAFMKFQRSPLESPRYAGAREVSRLFPFLASKSQHGALVWFDGLLTEPRTLARRLQDEAVRAGAVIIPQASVGSVERKVNGFSVKVSGGREFQADIVVNASGPWIRSIPGPKIPHSRDLNWCKGFNLVVRRQLDPRHAIGFESEDGRLFFVVPRNEGSAIGTWYLPVGDVSLPSLVSEDEAENFLKAFNRACPEFSCDYSDVVGIDVGYLPMRRNGRTGPELFGSEIVNAHNGYIEVMSTKYTTFRSQANRVSRLI